MVLNCDQYLLSIKGKFQAPLFRLPWYDYSLTKASEKAAPPGISHITQQHLQLLLQILKEISINSLFMCVCPAKPAEQWRLP
jgi:hypothetical protein